MVDGGRLGRGWGVGARCPSGWAGGCGVNSGASSRRCGVRGNDSAVAVESGELQRLDKADGGGLAGSDQRP
jgi:hypothetical protein